MPKHVVTGGESKNVVEVSKTTKVVSSVGSRLLLTSLVRCIFSNLLLCGFFPLPVCGCDLAQGGFFIKNGEYLCTLDYQRMYGTRCNGCGDFVEGEVVTALGKTYHPSCFACTVCK